MISIIEEMSDPEKEDIIYDLGSGDGRVLEVFAKKGFKCVGVEHNPVLHKLARKRLNYKNVKLIKGDIFAEDLSKASVIIAYLSRFVTKDLQKKVEKECKKETRIIVVSYKFDDWEPVQIRKWVFLPIRLYKV
jgi:predicted RNA methylase